MRRGKKVGELAVPKSTPEQVASLMIGAEAGLQTVGHSAPTGTTPNVS